MAIYIPPLRSYSPFYTQKEDDNSAVDIRSTYGVTVLVHEYPAKRKVKAPYKNDWKDRHGDDEWDDVLYYEATTMTLKCAIFAEGDNSSQARADLMTAVRAFQSYLLTGGAFNIYDDWTKYGYQKVRIDEFQEISEGDFDSFDGHCRLIFSVVLKLNDPDTRMVLSGSQIVEA